MSLLKSLVTYDSDTKKLVRIGRNAMRISNDGEYVTYRPALGTVDAVISYGVGKTVCYELELLNHLRKEVRVWFFDHTVDRLPTPHKRFSFKKEGVHARKARDVDTVESHIQSEPALREAKNMLLCMDIEGSEWEVLESLSRETMRRFSQILIEIHMYWQDAGYERMCRALDNINSGFKLIHVHANNNAKPIAVDGESVPPVLELTFVRNDIYEGSGEVCEVEYPRPIDKPNRETVPDYCVTSSKDKLYVSKTIPALKNRNGTVNRASGTS